MLFSVCKDGIFKSIQGEGENVGRSAVFVRFAGCNMIPKCEFCDEDYNDIYKLSEEEILNQIKRLDPFSMVVLTGGEPTLQKDLDKLVDFFHKQNYYVAIETNGLNPIPANIDWITCSPKKEYIHSSNTEVDELKFVVNKVEEDMLAKINKIEGKINCQKIFLQPESNKKEYISVCMSLIDKNPSFILSLQIHKIIGIK